MRFWDVVVDFDFELWRRKKILRGASANFAVEVHAYNRSAVLKLQLQNIALLKSSQLFLACGGKGAGSRARD